ncbi:uncharacterized protein FOMMEDRAFT_103583 [Fomitiporia mediterranea MF3/22]|uniref:uncharacterized protein n=1 Tax=Fomitiporia mediterranea (strain MF3/22) TaxID=694068 RepID=UPI000440774C|nr:uncharacterized protein FOMMEDRAFT_103583 [Fomitiporia mediterranea MF3/22]EJD05512.1 hypothetical protein FOMMEDRAFT_103583 [Fomitiporia mediterranea MF3/22]
MALVSASVDVFLLLSIFTVASWLYITFSARQPKRPETRNAQLAQGDLESEPQTRRFLSIFVALHSVYILYKLIITPPQNIFALLHVPLNEASDKIRHLLMEKAHVTLLPKSLEILLMRLQSFDVRISYVRFGHSAVQDCEHCATLHDFALYALPAPVLEYVRMSAIIGLATIHGSGREGWRFVALIMLSMVAATEVYFVLTSEVVFVAEEKQTIMLHDMALCFRRIFFLLFLPLLYLIPPRRKAPSLLQVLPDLAVRMERMHARLQLLRLTSAGRARHPNLHTSADAWWTRQRENGQSAMNDPTLHETVGKLGLSLDENETGADGKNLRARARALVGVLQSQRS